MTHSVLLGENEFLRRQQQKTSSRNLKFHGKFVNFQLRRTFFLEKNFFQKKNFLEKVILTKNFSRRNISLHNRRNAPVSHIIINRGPFQPSFNWSFEKFCPIPFSVLLPNQNSFQNFFCNFSVWQFQKCENLWDSRNFDNAKSWAWRDDVRCDVIFTDNTPTGENKGAQWTA